MNQLIKKYRNIFLCFFVISMFISLYNIIFIPSKRIGLFGIGLPAPMENYKGKHTNFSIDFPESWVIYETPQGNHGDQDVIAGIGVPGRSFPHVFLYKRNFLKNDKSELLSWGESKVKDDNKFIDLKPFNTTKYSGEMREYTREDKSYFQTITFISCNDYLMFEKQIGYMISFCAESKQWTEVKNTFNLMIESFSIY